MENKPRRNFLKKSVLGVSGIALIQGTLRPATPDKRGIDDTKGLPARVLGKTGIKTPLISMGTSGATSPNFIRAAYDAGIRVFFSATYYGEGNNEKLVGEGLKGLPRDSFVIGTAVPPDGLDKRTGLFVRKFDTAGYIKNAEASLKRFGMDHVDFFLFPYAGKRQMVLDEGVLSAMEQLKKQGKTRFVGIASHNDTEEALRAAADSGIYDVAMPAYNYKIPDRKSMHDALAYATRSGMGIVAMKTTAGGGEGNQGNKISTATALKWVLQNENIATVVTAMSNLDEMKTDIEMILNLDMTEQELQETAMTAPGRETGLYCLQCGKCLSQCPYDLDIPTLMRSYMYAYGYNEPRHAQLALSTVDLPSDPCGSCETCGVACTSGFDVRHKIRDISRLRNVPPEFLRI